jgi:hypothetical protein
VETVETSFLVTLGEMRTLLGQVGFEIIHQEDRREIALRHHRDRLAQLSAAGGPTPLGLHLLHRQTARVKSRKMVSMLEANQITLGVIIALRRA